MSQSLDETKKMKMKKILVPVTVPQVFFSLVSEVANANSVRDGLVGKRHER